MATQECTVCCEKYNKTTHLQIACEHACAFEACKTCIRKYILGTTADPHCMQCHKVWSDKFLVKNLNVTFMRNDYRLHRTELLVQQQLSRLPETMAAAERTKRTRAIQTTLRGFRNEQIQAERHLKELRYSCLHGSKEDKPKYLKDIETAKETVALLETHIIECRHNLAIIDIGGRVGEEKKEERKFIMPCGNTDCRGYLSTQYKCDLCEHHTCAKCFEHIGLVKEGSHECQPENIESAEFIKKQSKPCPCCGARISKIDGCDQMWCTQCHKAFSWETGNLVSGPVHNPHFYQYQREHGGAPRNPGDVVCGGLPTYYELNQKIAEAALPRRYQDFFYNTVMTIHRLQLHFTLTYIVGLQDDTEEVYQRRRIEYILQECTRDMFAAGLIHQDKKRKQNTALLHVCELFTTVGTDMFREILLSKKTGEEFAAELMRLVAEYDTLRQYVNEHLKEISMTYGTLVEQIDTNWRCNTTKFNAKGETDQYIIKREKLRQDKAEAKRVAESTQ